MPEDGEFTENDIDKFDSRIINEKEYNEIRGIVSAVEYESFFPMLYIIESEKVKNKCMEVSVADQ